ncbi:hypothetical protein SVI_2740 [Shewanella violacea DSS12]|uniref:Uncharacterized protein n=1 Tax=Shewanella violacea (strain JCM 10179 / CIP 106290 / LMG 19151 / DSS12) TaxID=637905 RepID=D4ZM12_SHEVD|nr:hypothetical protein SVI_2740 [Shewanella violacea DSS12]
MADFLPKKQYLHNVMFVFDICRAYTCFSSEERQTLPFREHFISNLIKALNVCLNFSFVMTS